MKKLLAGDVGATKTILGIYSAEKGPREPLAEATFSSSQYPGLAALVSAFLSQADLAVEHAVFGVAGPVVNGQATISNLSWRIDQEGLRKELGLKAVTLLNDVEATALGVPLLKPADLHCLNKGEPIPGGTRAVIAAGTGLGEAFLSWDGARYWAHASEGGHADFAPANPLEDDLLQHLRDLWGHVSYERICSGMGIPSLYAYLRESGHAEEPAWLAEQLAEADDPTALIVNAALEQKAQLCTDTLNLFVSVLGVEAGNLALKVLAIGGVYLGGGIPPRIISVLKKGPFMESFCRKGRLSEFMARIPVYVILNPKIALISAAFRGLELFQDS
jgi:glucokinase